jgi:hypothetical protein
MYLTIISYGSLIFSLSPCINLSKFVFNRKVPENLYPEHDVQRVSSRSSSELVPLPPPDYTVDSLADILV